MRSMNQRNTVTCTDSQGASPVRGNLHAGFLKEEEDGNILSLFNFKRRKILSTSLNLSVNTLPTIREEKKKKIVNY